MTMSNAGRTQYRELSKAKVTDTRNAVISECSRGGFTLAQQLEAHEGSVVTTVFMKNAIQIDSVERLIDLRDAINVAIQAAQSSIDDSFEDDEWED